MPQASPEPESAGSMPTTVLTAPLGAAGSRHCSSHSRLTGPPSGAEGTPVQGLPDAFTGGATSGGEVVSGEAQRRDHCHARLAAQHVGHAGLGDGRARWCGSRRRVRHRAVLRRGRAHVTGSSPAAPTAGIHAGRQRGAVLGDHAAAVICSPSSVRALAAHHRPDGPGDDPDIQAHGPVVDIGDVVTDGLVDR